MDEKNFRVRAHRPSDAYRMGKTWPQLLPDTFKEAAEAADAAEDWLRLFGKPGQSFCDLLFNGDNDPHTSIYFMGMRNGLPHYGVWNRPLAPWPVDYMDDHVGERLFDHPHFIAEGEDDLPPAPEAEPADEGKHKRDEDSKKMKLEDMEDEEEEWGDDDEDDEDWGDNEDDAESDSEDDGDEDGSEDVPEPDGPQEGNERDSEGSDDEEEEADEDGDDGDDEDDDENESDTDEEEEEPEMPRLNIFAKLRGPKGWRKRAETEELLEINTFGFKVGVLDPDGETPSKQEKNVRVDVKFIENYETRKHGVLEITLPPGCQWQAHKNGRKWIVEVPYYDED